MSQVEISAPEMYLQQWLFLPLKGGGGGQMPTPSPKCNGTYIYNIQWCIQDLREEGAKIVKVMNVHKRM